MYTIGERVDLGPDRWGHIRYVYTHFKIFFRIDVLSGEVEFADGKWLGVELPEGQGGKNDGSVRGHRYFSCKPECGIFVKISEEESDDNIAVTAVSSNRSTFLIVRIESVPSVRRSL